MLFKSMDIVCLSMLSVLVELLMIFLQLLILWARIHRNLAVTTQSIKSFDLSSKASGHAQLE